MAGCRGGRHAAQQQPRARLPAAGPASSAGAPPPAPRAQMLYKPAHEAALVLFGASETRSTAHAKAEADGDPGQFMGVVEAHG